jgi:hypothetical protein
MLTVYTSSTFNFTIFCIFDLKNFITQNVTILNASLENII